ncbi:shikimate dehydrogenase [Paenibacillus macquariensis]|uniref:shikimate dehydrogenase n=1 Tax=Paenibacillus macquariensis TaxID=948756 RepID=UPI0007C25209|nr:shikimate dehydrogenase [Paenibacillus macquariensis]MEC0091814.1 shikimate dehydrogenase [Paenibacillus macquariensis]OAB32276.1 shikimate dehydrogenase [Paenibacillus macquariensis subsp. macquariensis]
MLWRELSSEQNKRMLLAVIGDPIAHSKSPVMHNAALEALGIEGEYFPLHVSPEDLGSAISRFKELGFRGINVTIPHKVDVMKYLDQIDDSAARIGAVNTIVNENGILTGYNTDGIGYVRSLKDETHVDLLGKSILVLGAGGAARGIISALAQEDPKTLIIANRTEDKAIQMAEEWKSVVNISAITIDKVSDILADMDVVINTTSIGMHPNTSHTPIDPELIPAGIIVSDLIYNPLTTEFLKKSHERGCTIHGGLGMFVNQGAYALEFWTGMPAPIETMRTAVLKSLQN